MPTLNQRDYYARRAMEVRGYAEAAKDPEMKKTLETMAASYDRLVEEADKIAYLRASLESLDAECNEARKPR
jgi:hypothetical protein